MRTSNENESYYYSDDIMSKDSEIKRQATSYWSMKGIK